jgi:putative redox protein
MPSQKVTFFNKNNYELHGKLELPITQKPHAYAVFAHVFTGNKSLSATRNISRALTLNGIAVLRFDFTGLGESDGDFANSTFTSNVDDIIAACDFLAANYKAPEVIVGHSLGGAASIFAASKVESIKAVATIGAPSEPKHVKHLLASKIDEIEREGKAKVNIGGQEFVIKKEFLHDLENNSMIEVLKDFRKAILVLHSPQDTIVEIANAANIYHHAYHPKSFVTLNNANHMLTNKDDAYYAGNVISSWVNRYIDVDGAAHAKLSTHKQVVASLGSEGFTTDIIAGRHGFVADESERLGGQDFGPSPYEMLSASLGACTAMTLQMYARRKKWPLDEVKVHLSYVRSYKDDCEHCDNKDRRLDVFEREIELCGDLSDEQIQRLKEIADRCPVHRTLEANSIIKTKILHLAE